MAYAFQVPRQRTINSQAKTLNTGENLFDLQRQAPVSEGQQLAEQQNTQGLKTGQWADVQSAQNATNRQNALRTSNALQATRGTFARSGVDTSPEAAARAQDQSFSAAEGQNLNGTNAVNQLQRQYRNDAITQAGKNEQGYTDRQNATTNTIGTLGNLDIANKNADINQQNADTNQYSAVGDVADKTGRLALDTTKVGNDFTLGGRAADTAEKNATTNRLGVDNQHDEFGRKLSQDDAHFGVTSAQTDRGLNQEDTKIENAAKAAADRLGYDWAALSQNDRQFLIDDARKKSEFTVTSGIDQQNADTSKYSAEGAVKLGQDKLTQDDTHFGLTRGDSQKAQTYEEISKMPDGPSKNLALQAYYAGGDVGKTISGGINPDGSLKNPGMSPGTAAYQAKVDELQATYPNKSKAEIEAMVQARAEKADLVTQGVNDTGVQSLETKKALDMLRTNPTSLTPDQKNNLVASGDIKSFSTATAVPVGSAGKEMTGQMVKVGGDYYTVNNGGSVITDWNAIGSDNSHKDYTELKDSNGNPVYVVDGVLTQRRPVDAKKPSGISGVFNSFGF
jgi:hypothetical protein